MRQQIKVCLLAAALLISGSVCAQTLSPKREFRSAWLTTYVRIDWPTSAGVGTSATAQAQAKKELTQYLDAHQNRNFTGVCFQVRSMADAMYKSKYEPWSQYISGTRGTDPGWDPLAYIVEECHKRGLECYAWVNPYRYNRSWAARNTTQDKEWQAKGWFINQGPVSDKDKQLSTNEYMVFNPALPEVREHIINVCRDIYTNYRIDGILFDDYFYPNGIPANSTAMDYDNFRADNPGKTGTSQEIGDWRRENVNRLMRELYAKIQEERPDLRFGLSPAGVAKKGAAKYGISAPSVGTSDWQYDDIYSDPVAWLAEGSVDFISPQVYWFYFSSSNSHTSSAPYDVLSKWWNETASHFNRHAYISSAAYRLMNESTGVAEYNNEAHWQDLSKQIELNRQYTRNNAPGSIFYSAKYMDGPFCSGWGNYLEEHSYQQKSLIPLATWKNRPAISAPTVTKNGNTLSWTAPEQHGCDPIIRYTVYAVPNGITKDKAKDADGDGLSNKYLVAVVYGNKYDIPAEYRSDYWYAVCTYDGYGYESESCDVSYTGEDTPQPPVAKDETIYAEVDGITVTNLWYRSTASNFNNLVFDTTGDVNPGVLNRGIAICGDKLYLSGRTEQSANGVGYLREYNLETGEQIRDIKLNDLPTGVSGSYPCNDVITDNKGNIYVTNLTTNAATSPLTVYEFKPATGTLTHVATLTAEGVSPARIDHAAVYIHTDGAMYVYAAVASSPTLLRWKVVNAKGTEMKVVTASEFSPSSATNFGIAARAFVTSFDKVVVTGSTTYPAEYDFATGKILSTSTVSSDITPAGTDANGFAHFGPSECFMAYPSGTPRFGGYTFKVVSGATHGFTSSTKTMWTLPAFAMGTFESTTLSAPVAAKTVVENEKSWTVYLGVYAAGNALGVYKIEKKPSSAVGELSIPAVSYRINNGVVYFDAPVSHAAVYSTSGAVMGLAAETDMIEMPSIPGIYILSYDGNTSRIAVR